MREVDDHKLTREEEWHERSTFSVAYNGSGGRSMTGTPASIGITGNAWKAVISCSWRIKRGRHL